MLPKLKEAISSAGFDAFAIMSAEPLQRFLPILTKAKKEGRYPPFTDQDIRKRINPVALQPSAKSIIALAVAYNTGEPGPTPPLHGTISRSAWGRDYHKVLGERMDQLISFLQTELGAGECTKAVDTSFLVDRAIAVESGLGYPGSNCAVYVSPYGSWVFLAEILVDLKLPTTNIGQENWSSPVICGQCVRACPTNALIDHGKINPNRCLSYLTQMSGPIPLEFREKLGTRLWGCDTCQQACPINRQAPLSSHRDFKPIVGPHVPLLPLLEMDNKGFKEKFKETSIAWRGKNILQRNACIILGNQRNPEALEPLEKAVRTHPSPVVQEAARWAWDKIKGKV